MSRANSTTKVRITVGVLLIVSALAVPSVMAGDLGEDDRIVPENPDWDPHDPIVINEEYTAANPVDVFGPCDQGTKIDDICQAVIFGDCDEVNDKALEDVCNAFQLTPEVEAFGSWSSFECSGTALITNVEETTLTAGISDPTGVASFSVSETISSNDLEWQYDCSVTLHTWAVGKWGFSRQVEVDLIGKKTTCSYSGLPGDTECTTPMIPHGVQSTISRGATEDGDPYPTSVEISLSVPVEAHNRGVTLFGELPGLTVYDDGLATLTEDTVINWMELDGHSIAETLKENIEEILPLIDGESGNTIDEIETALDRISAAADRIQAGDIDALSTVVDEAEAIKSAIESGESGSLDSVEGSLNQTLVEDAIQDMLEAVETA